MKPAYILEDDVIAIDRELTQLDRFIKKHSDYLIVSGFVSMQKILIESQMQSSLEIFRKRFGLDGEFKKNARMHLKEIGLLR